MHLDYRFFVKFRNKNLWKKCMECIAMETVSGEEFSLFEISKVFDIPHRMNEMMEPIGMIFDVVTASEDDSFCFIHDHKKTKDYFFRLTNYLFEEIIRIAGEDAIMIADLTDYDTDAFGDYIFYYLGGGKSEIKQCIVDKMDHHDIELSDFIEMLKYESLTDNQKGMLKAIL